MWCPVTWPTEGIGDLHQVMQFLNYESHIGACSCMLSCLGQQRPSCLTGWANPFTSWKECKWALDSRCCLSLLLFIVVVICCCHHCYCCYCRCHVGRVSRLRPVARLPWKLLSIIVVMLLSVVVVGVIVVVVVVGQFWWGTAAHGNANKGCQQKVMECWWSFVLRRPW